MKAKSLRLQSANTRTVIHRTAAAADCIGRLAAGDRITGVTGGQFSAIDALEHMVDELGESDVRVSTWTTGLYDVTRAAQIKAGRRIRSIRMLVDRGTFEKSPQYAAPLIAALGVDAFRCLSVHAKVIIVHGDRAAAVMRTSMNLNKNLRTEHLDIDVNDDIAEFYRDWFDSLWDESGLSKDNAAIIKAVYDRGQIAGSDKEHFKKPHRFTELMRQSMKTT